MDSRNQKLLLIALALGASVAYMWYKRAPNPSTGLADSLLVGTNAEFQPFTFIDNDEIVGFDIDIATEIAKRLNKKIEFKNMSFEALIPEIQLGRIHMIAAGMTESPERAQRVLFAKPHLTDNNPLVVVTTVGKEPLKTIEDLKGKNIAVNQGYTADTTLSAHEGINLNRLSSSTISEGLLVLQSGRADGYVAAKNSVMPYFKQYGTGTFTFEELPGTNENASIAVSKKYPELLPLIQKALDDMEQDGTIAQLKEKWNL